MFFKSFLGGLGGITGLNAKYYFSYSSSQDSLWGHVVETEDKPTDMDALDELQQLLSVIRNSDNDELTKFINNTDNVDLPDIFCKLFQAGSAD